MKKFILLGAFAVLFGVLCFMDYNLASTTVKEEDPGYIITEDEQQHVEQLDIKAQLYNPELYPQTYNLNLTNIKVPTLYVIGRTGCSYCEEYKPIIEELYNEYGNQYRINYLLLDVNENYKGMLGASTRIPTTYVYKANGELAHEEPLVGPQTKEYLLELLND